MAAFQSRLGMRVALCVAVLVAAAAVPRAQACSPPENYRSLSLYELFQNDKIKSVFLMYIYGGALLTEKDKFAGFVDKDAEVDVNLPFNMLAYRSRALKGGCEFEDESFMVLTSVPVLCGVLIQERGWFIVGVTKEPTQKTNTSLPVYDVGFADTFTGYTDVGYDEFTFAYSQVRSCDGDQPVCNNGKPYAACKIGVCSGCPGGREPPKGWYCEPNFCLSDDGCLPVAEWFDSVGQRRPLECVA